jgi:hypothetical protein
MRPDVKVPAVDEIHSVRCAPGVKHSRSASTPRIQRTSYILKPNPRDLLACKTPRHGCSHSRFLRSPVLPAPHAFRIQRQVNCQQQSNRFFHHLGLDTKTAKMLSNSSRGRREERDKGERKRQQCVQRLSVVCWLLTGAWPCLDCIQDHAGKCIRISTLTASCT